MTDGTTGPPVNPFSLNNYVVTTRGVRHVRNATDAPDDMEIYGPLTPPQARFGERILYASLWTIGVKGTF